MQEIHFPFSIVHDSACVEIQLLLCCVCKIDQIQSILYIHTSTVLYMFAYVVGIFDILCVCTCVNVCLGMRILKFLFVGFEKVPL